VTATYVFEVHGEPSGYAVVAHEACRVTAGSGDRHVYEVRDGQFARPVPGVRVQLRPGHLALPLLAATEEYGPVYDLLTSLRFYSPQPGAMSQPGNGGPGEALAYDGENAPAVLRALEAERPHDYERLCRFLELVVPGVERVRSDGPPDRDIELKFEQNVGPGDRWTLDAFEMSDGTLRALGVLLAIYQPRTPSVVAIEEPEAVIHPAAVEVIFAALADGAKRSQVIVTTHSADILDLKEVQDRHLRLVDYRRGETIIQPPSGGVRDLIRRRLFTPGELLRDGELLPEPPADAR
jgi:hypothetical protein